MEKMTFYANKDSPVFESPLGLFDVTEDGAILEEEYGIPRRYLKSVMSPWAVKRLRDEAPLYRNDRYGNVHVPIGKVSFDAEQLLVLASQEVIDLLVELCDNIEMKTVCVLSAACTMPVRSYLNKFRHEFEAYVSDAAS